MILRRFGLWLLGLALWTGAILIADASGAQPADVDARVEATDFSCGIQTLAQGPNEAPIQSVSLIRVDDGTNALQVCVDVGNDASIRAGFTVAYDGSTPLMRGLSHAESACTGLTSVQSVNACRVVFRIAPPVIVP